MLLSGLVGAVASSLTKPPYSAMLLYLIRHPQPDIAPGICYGHADIAVSPQQCASVQQSLPTSLRQSLAAGTLPLYASPLQRCADLARLLHPAPCFDARLMELDFGRWELQPWDSIPRAEIDAWAADVVGYAPGGGESALAMAQRVQQFLHQLGAAKLAQAAMVAHAGSLRMMMAWQRGTPAGDVARMVALQPQAIQFGQCMMCELDM